MIYLEKLGRFFAVMFILSSFGKVQSFKAFIIHLKGFSIIRKVPAIVAILTILAELILGTILLILPLWLPAILFTLVLLTVFTMLIIAMLKSPVKTGCFCQGENEDIVSGVTLIRNFLLIVSIIPLVCFGISFEWSFRLSDLLSIVYGASAWLLFHNLYLLIQANLKIRYL